MVGHGTGRLPGRAQRLAWAPAVASSSEARARRAGGRGGRAAGERWADGSAGLVAFQLAVPTLATRGAMQKMRNQLHKYGDLSVWAESKDAKVRGRAHAAAPRAYTISLAACYTRAWRSRCAGGGVLTMAERCSCGVGVQIHDLRFLEAFPEAWDLILALTQEDPGSRLGVYDAFSHPFLSGFVHGCESTEQGDVGEDCAVEQKKGKGGWLQFNKGFFQ